MAVIGRAVRQLKKQDHDPERDLHTGQWATDPEAGPGHLVPDGSAAQAVREAIAIGYRNIDTVQAYGNEHGVGDGVRSSGVPRSNLFVSSKLAAVIKDYDGAVAAIDGSLTTMGWSIWTCC